MAVDKKNLFCTLSLVLTCASLVSSQHFISGELHGELAPDKYIVAGTIYVLPGQTLRIAAGSTLLFEQFTGIVVRGNFECNGTIEKPVLFTSTREVEGGAEPFDWNGIKITPEAQHAVMRHAHVRNSTFGVAVQSEFTPVTLESVVFFNNGYTSLSRDDKLIETFDNIPVNYRWDGPIPTASALMNDAQKETASARTFNAKRVARIGTVIVAAGGVGAMVAGHIAAQRRNHAYLAERDPSKIEAWKQARDNAVIVRNLGFGILGGGCAGFGITFLFGERK